MMCSPLPLIAPCQPTLNQCSVPEEHDVQSPSARFFGDGCSWAALSTQAGLSGDSEASDSCSVRQDAFQAEPQRMSATKARRIRRQRAAASFHKQGSVNVRNRPTKPTAECLSELSAQLEAGSESVADVVYQVRGSVQGLAFDSRGCRILQKLIERAIVQDAANLVTELHGCVQKAIDSPHANHVIAKIIQVLPANCSQFVPIELRGSAVETARHQYGTRVLQRLVEQSSQASATADVMGELLGKAEELCRDEYGHHVLKAILEHGLPEQKRWIIAALDADIVGNAHNRSAVYVIEAALQHCDAADQERLATSLLNQPDCLVCLAGEKSGSHLVKVLFHGLPSGRKHALRRLLQQAVDRGQMTVDGCQVLKELDIDFAEAA